MPQTRAGAGRSRSRVSWLGWSAVAGLLAAAVVAPGPAASTDGNNGTVKIHEGSTETEPIVRNEPHVCTFHLHFFFADPFEAGTWEIQEWSPGDKGTVVLSGTYDTNGDGEDRDPETGVHELPDGHYKLFWDGDQDSLKHDKHKVFWVDCEGGSNPSPTPTFFGSEGAATDSPTGTPGGTVGSTPTFGGSVGGLTTPPDENLTQPPTDTGVPGSAPEPGGLRMLLLLLAAVLAMFLLSTPRQPVERRR